MKNHLHARLQSGLGLTGALLALFSGLVVTPQNSQAATLANAPMYISSSSPPLIMLTMGRDHKLYYEAYNDYSDLNGDNKLDVGYKPAIEYYGYFDSYKCYSYTGGIFTPVAMSDSSVVDGKTVYNKKCTGSGRDYWSGDFLNYVTTARIDALRKVLYGGYRSTDSASQTILERTFVPQDAHAWGKEYKDVTTDGYDITQYTPLSLPESGKRHLFANVTLTGYGQAPLMRILSNSTYRIWEWVSIERPVAGSKCLHGSTGPLCTSGTGALNTGSPANAAEFATWVNDYAVPANLLGTSTLSTIDANDDSGKPAAVPNDNYMDITTGTLTTRDRAEYTGTYEFSADGDDAVEVWINGELVTGWYGGHGKCGNNDDCRNAHKGSINLVRNASYTIEFRHQEATGGSNWQLYWKRPGSTWEIVPDSRLGTLTQNFYTPGTPSNTTMTDYNVRVEVCKEISGVGSDAYFGREANCKSYSNGAATPVLTYKPTGLLHSYGDNNGMFFGLLSGSYDQNTNGGILRKAVSSITNEIETTTGIFKESGTTCGLTGSSTCVTGIIGTINRFHIINFNYSDYAYSGTNCGWITTRAMNNGECENWGNPLAEMAYEAIRYFSGATSATTGFTTSQTRDDGVTLPGGTSGLPRITTWTDPYSASATVPIPNTGPFPVCSKPFLMLISDVYPSFDSDQVPGADSNFGTVAAASINGASLDAASRGTGLWNLEFGTSATKNIFIGQVGATIDGAPTAKSASSFGNIRGLSPSDPTRQGSYYTASVANFAKLNDINAVTGTQQLGTYSIALSAPLPTIQIPIPNTTNFVTIVPFAKSVGGMSISETATFQPTNQIVDFYVDTIKNVTALNEDTTINSGRPYYKFRINFEDVEQGADHDMDAIAVYEVLLNGDNTITIKVESIYAAGGIIQHMGYVVSGTTADGIYLVVRDKDTGYSSDPEYFLDRPKSTDAGADSSKHLPLLATNDPDVPDASNYATRTFTANTNNTSATTLHDPLWYASKYGGFGDTNGDNIPQQTEWDGDNDGVPDTYFLVVNPLKLLAQLDAALSKIRDSAGTAAATTSNSFSLQTDTQIFVGRYNTDGWSGEVIAYPVSSTGIGNASWRAHVELADKTPTSRTILTYDQEQATTKGIPFRWASMSTTGATTLRTALNKTSQGTTDALGEDRVSFLRGESISGMRTRPQIQLTTVTGSCTGTYVCPAGGGTAVCTGGGSVTCTPSNKTNLLGDIINSQSQYVGRPNNGHIDSSYSKFAANYNASTNSTGKGDRTAMVYVGANDGMLHGFSAATGEELLAYVPGEMYRLRNGRWVLNKLTETDYGKNGSTNTHRYFVDGTPTVVDICVTENVADCPDGDWRTILVGGLGAGGQGVFALDVTDPANFQESNAGSLVKWEFSDKNDVDLGYTVGRPYLTKLCTTRTSGTCSAWTWYVLINNGYNNTEADGYVSTSGDAALFILNANTGALVKKIPVIEGDTTSSGPNGLSEIAPMDTDGDGVIDYVYAGDLKGNFWRFDFTGDSSADWRVAFGATSNPDPLYVAWDEQTTRVRQAITTAADAIFHPQGGLLLTFGTGKYLFTNDDQSTQLQTIYGIWDKLDGSTITSTGRSNLQQQSIYTATATASSTSSFEGVTATETDTYRTVSENTVDWTEKRGWYINLPDSGERIGYNPQILGGTILRVSSIVPSSDICDAGGYSWEYFVDALTGGRLSWSVYSSIGGTLNFGGVEAYASARKSTTGITPPGVIITNPSAGGKSVEFSFGTQGGGRKTDIDTGKAGHGRLSWRELMTD
ncbi:MAG: PilC/PilY family type IV pilus protein [Azonexus sp.]